MGVDVKKKAEERESIVRVSSVGGVYNRKLIAAIFQPGAFKEGLLLLYSNKERKKKKKKKRGGGHAPCRGSVYIR